MKPLRESPLHAVCATRAPEWGTVNGMRVPLRFPGEEPARLARLAVGDLSGLARAGVKGPGAADWLAAQGIPVPAAPNSWAPLPGGGLVARLGLSEFLLEDGPAGDTAVTFAATPTPPRAYPVLRQDAALALRGGALPELLAQTCSVNFRALEAGRRPVVLTTMAGVAVTLIPSEEGGVAGCRVWCDGSYGFYLWRSLLGIAEELGGGAAGWSWWFPG